MFKKYRENWLNKILDNAASRKAEIKKYSIYCNSEELSAKCVKIKSIYDYKSMIEFSTFENEDEWFLIMGINKISKSRIMKNKEYIFTNSRNIVEHILINPNDNIPDNFSNIFIVPKGSVSFFGIELSQRLWIK